MPKKSITDVPETLDKADYRDKIIENLINEVQDLKALVQQLSSRIIEKEGE